MCFGDRERGCVHLIYNGVIFLVNLLLAVAGFSLLVLGIILLAKIFSNDDFYLGNAKVLCYILILAGSLTFTLAFLSCFGTIKKSIWVFYTYAGCLFVLSMLHLAGGIITWDAFETGLLKEMKVLMLQYPSRRATWDELQTKLQCCGIFNYMDWIENNPVLGGIPGSCNCLTDSLGCTTLSTTSVHDTGCYTKLEPCLMSLGNALSRGALAVAIFNFVALVISIYQRDSFKFRRQVY